MGISVTTLLIGGLVVIFGVLVWTLIPHRRRLKRFTGREDMAPDRIYNEFFSASGFPKDLVLELWNEIAIPLRVPPGMLRPSDRFDKELAPIEGWEFDDDRADVDSVVNQRLKKLVTSTDLSAVQTLGDYVKFFCNLELAKRSCDS
jgi:hypothetical protein